MDSYVLQKVFILFSLGMKNYQKYAFETWRLDLISALLLSRFHFVMEHLDCNVLWFEMNLGFGILLWRMFDVYMIFFQKISVFQAEVIIWCSNAGIVNFNNFRKEITMNQHCFVLQTHFITILFKQATKQLLRRLNRFASQEPTEDIGRI